MRCPKCSFISFDDLAVCAKCAGDLSALSRELNGTCIESKPEFFLGTAIQSSGMDGDNFSDSQVLPPIDHGGINFDDTSTGGFSPLSSADKSVSRDFDDSVGLSNEDDVAIELGDIMPIDLDQLDDTSVFSGAKMAETDSFDPASFVLDFDKTETVSVGTSHDVDLDLTGKFASTNLDLELDGDFPDIDIDDSALDFPGNSISPADHESSQEMLSIDSKTQASLNNSVGVDLDDELIAQLSSFVDDPDSTASFLSDSSSVTESGANGMDVSGASEGILDFDESLAAELTGSFPVNDESNELTLDYSEDQSGSGEFELDAALVAELSGDSIPGSSVGDVGHDLDSEGTDFGASIDNFIMADSVETPIEDLTGEFAPVSFSDEPELGDLNLSDIDVSDLIDSSVDSENSPAEVEEGGGVTASVVQSVGSSVDELPMELVDDDLGGDSAQQLSLSEVAPQGIVPSGLAELPEISLQPEDEVVLEESLLGSDLFDEIDVSDFEVELSGGSTGSISPDDALPEIELIPDGEDEEDGPPDLPL